MGGNGSRFHFILISDQPYYFGCPEEITHLSVTLIHPSPHPQELLSKVRDTVDDYIQRVLEDYHDLGLTISFEKDRARIGPALKKKRPLDGERLLLRSCRLPKF